MNKCQIFVGFVTCMCGSFLKGEVNLEFIRDKELSEGCLVCCFVCLGFFC